MSESASASIDALQLGTGLYQYTITLTDTGSTSIGTYWFSWIPGAGYLPDMPSPSEPAGWTVHVTNGPPPSDGYSIQWAANSTSSAVQPGGSLQFIFTSTTSPPTLFGESSIHPPIVVDTATIYSGEPFSDSGFVFAANSTYQQLFVDGVYAGVDYFFIASGQPYSSYEYDYSVGGDFIGSNFFYIDITGQAYTGEEIDYDGGGSAARVAFSGVTGAPYSSYEYDYVDGVFSGSRFNYTSVPAGATYSSYEVDYDWASVYAGEKFFFTEVTGQSYTSEEVDFDANSKLSRVVLTGVSGQPYYQLEEDYSAGVYSGYKAYYAITGQAYSNEEVDVSASGQIDKVVYSGMTSTPYSSVEEDYSGGSVNDTIYDFTNVAGANYYAYQVEDNAGGTALQETLDHNNRAHFLYALEPGQTLTGQGDDIFTAGGNGETTFVLNAIYGADTIIDFTDTDTVLLPAVEYAQLQSAIQNGDYANANAALSFSDRDTLTFRGMTETSLEALSSHIAPHG